MSVLGPQDEGLEGVVLANRYRIDKRLGAGGMGEVYRATNVVIDRPVAIKVLHRELTRNAEIVERFLREAKAASVVRHPNVVDVLDVLEHEGVPFIVQELLNGRDLAKYVELSGGSLSVDEALSLLIPVIEAVGIANAKGVVHRDLKPENVFLHEVEGQVIPKVLDFGISKLTTADVKRMTSTRAPRWGRPRTCPLSKSRAALASILAATCGLGAWCSSKCSRAGFRSKPRRRARSSCKSAPPSRRGSTR
jgi:serine/threonine protein kinase